MKEDNIEIKKQPVPPPFGLLWHAAPSYGDNDSWYVVCFSEEVGSLHGVKQTFWVMAKDLTQSVAKHLVKLHNEWVEQNVQQ